MKALTVYSYKKETVRSAAKNTTVTTCDFVV